MLLSMEGSVVVGMIERGDAERVEISRSTRQIREHLPSTSGRAARWLCPRDWRLPSDQIPLSKN
jgi:uncharacterized protein (DUF3084 family)